jgi:hypothetical protein
MTALSRDRSLGFGTTTKEHMNTIRGGPVTFDYFSMEPTTLLKDPCGLLGTPETMVVSFYV